MQRFDDEIVVVVGVVPPELVGVVLIDDEIDIAIPIVVSERSALTIVDPEFEPARIRLTQMN